MNIYNYIDDYGIYSFEEKKFNDVDAMIFAYLTYANLEDIFKEYKRVSIFDAGRIHLGLYNKKDNNIVAVKEANKLLRYMKDSKRYKDCILYNYEYIGNNDIMFGVVSIEYELNKVYVSFEGTDALFSGWKENFLLASEYPTTSQKLATQYLNKHFTFSTKSLMVGGHSKGGNLALSASMNANWFVRKKITNVFSGDGPGLLLEEFVSKRYNEVEKKYTHIMPETSIVGILLNHSQDKVIESEKKGIYDHNIVNWHIEKDHFKKAPLSRLSTEIDKGLSEWIKNHTIEERRAVAISFEELADRANVHSILELKENIYKVISLLYESKNIEENVKKMINELLEILVKSIGETTKIEWKKRTDQLFRKE